MKDPTRQGPATKPADKGDRRTGPGTGNRGGNDLPSEGQTQRDTRQTQGGSSPQGDGKGGAQRTTGAKTGVQPPGERASGSGMGVGGETDFDSKPGL